MNRICIPTFLVALVLGAQPHVSDAKTNQPAMQHQDTGEEPGVHAPADNLILITLDGLRWEELFAGADPWLLDSDYSDDASGLRRDFWAGTPDERARKLMPFFHGVLRQQGRLIGDRSQESKVDVTNTRVFSYPGYNEILTGFADSEIDSNDKIPNENVTVLEWLNRRSEFHGKVAAFGSWDVFPCIINEERSGIPVNAGFESVRHPQGAREAFLNELQTQIPSPWGTVRLDAFTHHFALETLKRRRPRVLYIAYGETDDFAHNGSYDQYLRAAHRTDAFIRELWEYVQSAPGYQDRTAVLITTDHGRGDEDGWIGHGTGDPRWDGSQYIWMGAIGAGVPAADGMIQRGQWYQNQVAATAAALLGLDYDGGGRAGSAVGEFLDR